MNTSGDTMTKTTIKRMFKAIEDGAQETLREILDANPPALETVGFHNRLVRDKTPLMFAMQCHKFSLVHWLIDRGANASAVMPGGPKSSTLGLCAYFAYCDRQNHDEWIKIATRLLDQGADPNAGLWPALHGFGRLVNRADLIKLLLDRGADPDRKVGNCANTVRELVAVNRRLYSSEVLALFGVGDSGASTEPSGQDKQDTAMKVDAATSRH